MKIARAMLYATQKAHSNQKNMSRKSSRNLVLLSATGLETLDGTIVIANVKQVAVMIHKFAQETSRH